jgi:hypothetical protein
MYDSEPRLSSRVILDRIWLPLVDALRTILLAPPTEVRETIVGLRLGFPFPGSSPT